jgi:hypothetical protein
LLLSHFDEVVKKHKGYVTNPMIPSRILQLHPSSTLKLRYIAETITGTQIIFAPHSFLGELDGGL